MTAFRAALFGADTTAVRTIDLGAGCWLLQGKLPHALQPSDTERKELWAAQPQEREQFEMYGRTVDLPRHVQLYGTEQLVVRVNGNDFQAASLGDECHPSFLGRLLAGVPACHYNAVVANWYSSGNDHIGWHGDKEAQIDASAPIVSVSLGSPRRFQVRDEASRAYVFDELLSDGDCVVMGGSAFQRKFKHRVPKMTAQRDGQVGPRINLTVRKYKDVAPRVVKKRAGEVVERRERKTVRT